MRTCFVPLCDALSKNEPKRMMFSAPKDMFNIWKATLPKRRDFRVTDKVCYRHFRKEDITTTFDHIIGGQLFQMERERPKLNPTAVPDLNLPTDEMVIEAQSQKSIKRTTPKEFVQKIELKSKKRKTRGNSNNAIAEQELEKYIDKFVLIGKRTVDVPSEQEQEEQEHSDESRVLDLQAGEVILPTEKLTTFETFYEDIYEVVLPNTLWAVHRCPEHEFVSFSYMDPKKHKTTKWMVIESTGITKTYMVNKMIRWKLLNEELSDPENISNLISELDENVICLNACELKECLIWCENSLEYCKSCENTGAEALQEQQ